MSTATPSTAASFLADFHELSLIGATDAGGVDRQAATDEDRQSRDWFRRYAEERGWEVRVDGIGNEFALVEWTLGAPYVLVGSHLDSQPLGGRFDGAYGVMAGLHAADRIVRQVDEGTLSRPRFNLAVVNWFNEEGGRFAPSLMGSGSLVGTMDQNAMLEVRDLDGVTVRDALQAIGYLGAERHPEIAGYAEIHIEQGRVLERTGIPLGAVDYSWHTQKLDISCLGEQSHTGATLMSDRRDALVAAAEVILAVHEVTTRFAPETLVSSVGRMTLEPNSPIVVARRVDLVADLRADDPQVVAEARRWILERLDEISERTGVRIVATDFDVRERQYYPEEGVVLAEKAAAELGLDVTRLRTMAGHDSVAMNRVVPAVMLFIPSVDGVSHCERELSRDEDMVAGVDWLTQVVAQLVTGALDDGRRHRDERS